MSTDPSTFPPDPELSHPAAPLGLPRLPDAVAQSRPIVPQPSDGSLARADGGPSIPPLETTAPDELVATLPSPESQAAWSPQVELPYVPGRHGFAPLRSEPPPGLLPTWLLRSTIFLSLLAAIVATLFTEYTGEIDDVRRSPIVLALHAVAFVAVLGWSSAAMHNAHELVPATRYHRASQGWLAALLWCVALLGPIGAIAVHGALRTRLENPDDLAAFGILAGAVFVAFVFAWMPFRYHAKQAARIGAPHRAMIGWFWAPLAAGVGSISILSLGLREQLADDGLTLTERTAQVGVLYGLPMIVLALSSWRAVTVFDEVIDLRWRRWKNEWEQTLESMAAEPTPGPEDSPHLGSSSGRRPG